MNTVLGKLKFSTFFFSPPPSTLSINCYLQILSDTRHSKNVKLYVFLNSIDFNISSSIPRNFSFPSSLRPFGESREFPIPSSNQLKREIFKILRKDVVYTFPLDISFWHAFRVPYVFPSGTRAFLPPVSPGPSDRECSMNGRVYNSAIIQSVTTSSSSINHPLPRRNIINISFATIDRSNRYLSEKKKKEDFSSLSSATLFLNHMIAHRGQMELSIDEFEKGSGSILWRVWSFYRFYGACLLACLLAVQVSINK